MKDVIIIYIITQLITTAYGIAVIESVRPFVEKELRDNGYHRNKNSLYNFNNSAGNFFKAFIPFYYFAKAMRVVMKKTAIVEEAVDEEINKGSFVMEDETPEIDNIQVIEDPNPNMVDNIKVAFEKPEVYKARKNGFSSLYDTYETPIDYITRESTNKKDLNINPFVNDRKDIDHVVVKESVTNKDVAKAICDLSADELYALRDKILRLEQVKRENKTLSYKKDVA